MSEKPPQFERPPIPVYGNLPEEVKERISDEFQQKFREGELTELSDELLEQIKNLEYDKRTFELDFIETANRVINNLREKYGLPAFDVPGKNIHIIPPELFRKLSAQPFTAFHDYRRQLIFADADKLRYSDNKLSSASLLFHEMSHLKGFLSLDARMTKGKDGKEETERSYRRIGLMISEGYRNNDRDEWYESFRGLNEAVVVGT